VNCRADKTLCVAGKWSWKGVMDKSGKRVVIAAFVIQAVIGYLLLHYG